MICAIYISPSTISICNLYIRYLYLTIYYQSIYLSIYKIIVLVFNKRNPYVRAGTQVYPLFATTGVAVGICVMQLVRNITTNPEVRVTKEKRAAGVLDNHDEGRRYSQHGVRRFWLSKRRDYMQAMDKVPTDPNK